MFVLYIVLALYFINFGFEFIKIPEVISNFNKWIIFAGGILLIIGGINFMKTRKYRY